MRIFDGFRLALGQVKGHHQDLVMRDGGRIIAQNFGSARSAVPTAAPALTNAIAALTGTRIRRLPITKTIMVY